MDQGTAYIAAKLDQVIDRQRDHGEMLRQLQAAVSKLQETASSRSKGRYIQNWERLAEKLSTKLLTFGILLASGGITVIEALKVALK